MASITEVPQVQRLLRKTRRHGLWSTLRQAALRLVERAIGLRVVRGLHLASAGRVATRIDERHAAGFVPREALRELAADPRNEISRRFLDEALRRGDRCFVIRDGTRVASTSWYSTRATRLGPAELMLHFYPQHVYMHKAFTHPDYRGQRLYEAGVRAALDYYAAKGARGLICGVEATYLDSLKACARMGFRPFGSLYVIRIFGRHFAFSSPGCRRFGFRVEAQRSSPAFTPREAPLAP